MWVSVLVCDAALTMVSEVEVQTLMERVWVRVRERAVYFRTVSLCVGVSECVCLLTLVSLGVEVQTPTGVVSPFVRRACIRSPFRYVPLIWIRTAKGTPRSVIPPDRASTDGSRRTRDGRSHTGLVVRTQD